MNNNDCRTPVDDGKRIPDYDDDPRFPYDLSDDEIHPPHVWSDNHAALDAETDIEPSARR
jgi:hypothetical protein